MFSCCLWQMKNIFNLLRLIAGRLSTLWWRWRWGGWRGQNWRRDRSTWIVATRLRLTIIYIWWALIWSVGINIRSRRLIAIIRWTRTAWIRGIWRWAQSRVWRTSPWLRPTLPNSAWLRGWATAPCVPVCWRWLCILWRGIRGRNWRLRIRPVLLVITPRVSLCWRIVWQNYWSVRRGRAIKVWWAQSWCYSGTCGKTTRTKSKGWRTECIGIARSRCEIRGWGFTPKKWPAFDEKRHWNCTSYELQFCFIKLLFTYKIKRSSNFWVDLSAMTASRLSYSAWVSREAIVHLSPSMMEKMSPKLMVRVLVLIEAKRTAELLLFVVVRAFLEAYHQ